MFNQHTRLQNKRMVFLGITGWGLSLMFLLSACTSPSDEIPLQIVNVSVTPEPVVGRIVTLEVQIMSTEDEADVILMVNTLEKEGMEIHLVSGESEWTGPLISNQPKIFQVSMCVSQEGSWPIEISAASRLSEGKNKYLAFETIHIESTLNSGRLIRSWEYTFSQEEATRRPTPEATAP